MYAILGMSMGGVLTATIWENKRLKTDKIIMESSPLMSSGKFMTKMLTNTYLMLTHKTQQRDKKVVEQAINFIISKDKLDVFLEMMDNMSDETIINYLKAVGKYKLPNNIDTLDTNVYYYYGTKINEMLAKKTAKYIKKNYPNSNIICFNGKGHCENSLLNPKEMIKELDKVYNRELEYEVELKTHYISKDGTWMLYSLLHSYNAWTYVNGIKYAIIITNVEVNETNVNDIYQGTVRYKYSLNDTFY